MSKIYPHMSIPQFLDTLYLEQLEMVEGMIMINIAEELRVNNPVGKY